MKQFLIRLYILAVYLGARFGNLFFAVLLFLSSCSSYHNPRPRVDDDITKFTDAALVEETTEYTKFVIWDCDGIKQQTYWVVTVKNGKVVAVWWR